MMTVSQNFTEKDSTFISVWVYIKTILRRFKCCVFIPTSRRDKGEEMIEFQVTLRRRRRRKWGVVVSVKLRRRGIVPSQRQLIYFLPTLVSGCQNCDIDF